MVRAGTRSARHRPYPERNRKSCQWVEIFIALLRSSRNGIVQLKPIYPKKTPHERLPHTGLLPRSPFGIRWFKPILPFLGGRSDAACRVVIKTVGLMVGGAWAVGGGIFALRRPRPYSRCLRGCPCVSHCDPDVAIAAASMRVPCRPWKTTFL